MATLHHHPLCPHSRFIRLVLGEFGLDADLVEEQVWERSEAFLQLDPQGRTPVFVEGQIGAVPGAAVIAEYLDEAVRRRALQQYVSVLAGRATVTGIDLAGSGPLVQ